MRSRFPRSYTFWLGILVPVFLLWVWVLSTSLHMEISVAGPRSFRFDHQDGYLRLVTWRDPDLAKWGLPVFESTPEPGRFFPGFGWRWQRDREFVDIQVSHWFLLVGYAVVFWGLRHWHGRRYRLEEIPRPEV